MVGFVEGDAELVASAFGGVGEGSFEESVNGKFVGVKGYDFAGASFHGGRGADGGLTCNDAVLDGDSVGLGVKDGLDLDGNAIAIDIFGLPLALFGCDQEVRLGGSGNVKVARDEKGKCK